jgi:hypothetical protein
MEAWVGCLGCYNAGALVGAWVDGLEAEDLEPHDHLASAGITAPACGAVKTDERWVFDTDGAGGLISGECSPSEFQRVAKIVEEVEADGYPVDAFEAYVENYGSLSGETSRETYQGFVDSYAGEYRNGSYFAADLAEDLGVTPSEGWPGSCIDWDDAWRELETGGDYWEADAPGGMVYIFRAN